MLSLPAILPAHFPWSLPLPPLLNAEALGSLPPLPSHCCSSWPPPSLATAVLDVMWLASVHIGDGGSHATLRDGTSSLCNRHVCPFLGNRLRKPGSLTLLPSASTVAKQCRYGGTHKRSETLCNSFSCLAMRPAVSATEDSTRPSYLHLCLTILGQSGSHGMVWSDKTSMLDLRRS